MIALHPERTDDPQVLRWVVATGACPHVGTLVAAGGELGHLLDDGTIAVEAGPSSLLVRLRDGADWRTAGPSVRSALQDALADPGSWVLDGPDDDATRLRAAVQEVLAGQTGELIASHGGRAEVVAVQPPRVTLALTGACHGCPASGVTLQERIVSDLRRRYGGPVEVVEATGSGTATSGSSATTGAGQGDGASQRAWWSTIRRRPTT